MWALRPNYLNDLYFLVWGACSVSGDKRNAMETPPSLSLNGRGVSIALLREDLNPDIDIE